MDCIAWCRKLGLSLPAKAFAPGLSAIARSTKLGLLVVGADVAELRDDFAKLYFGIAALRIFRSLVSATPPTQIQHQTLRKRAASLNTIEEDDGPDETTSQDAIGASEQLALNHWKFSSAMTLAALCLAMSVGVSAGGIAENSPQGEGDDMAQAAITVSIDDQHLSQIEQVSQALQRSGMTVEQTLPIVGIITGTMPSEKIDDLREIEGVQSIELQQGYQLPAPGSDIQ